jgi:L-asparaginase
MRQEPARPKIAIFAGPTATILNNPPLVTGNKAREKYGLPLITGPGGGPARFDSLRAQRLAAPVTVYVEQFSAHPLERDVADAYAPPDGYVDSAGAFHTERQSPTDVPVYEVTLRPDDGLYLLPYMARQANGQAWDDDFAYPGAPATASRQPYFPDASRLLEEIDRFGLGENGRASVLSSLADFDFYRPVPSSGYMKGLVEAQRADVGEGDIPPETPGQDFFAYRPFHLSSSPPRGSLARLTNEVQRAMASGTYSGAIWLEGSPSVEETLYWLNVLIDTDVPIAGNSAQRAHGSMSADGDRNITDSVNYILSRIWADEAGRDAVGAVVVQDEQIFTAREVQKGDARPGGYVATGGHGGIVGTIGQPGPPVLTFIPARRHTYQSMVALSRVPASVDGVQRVNGRVQTISVPVKNDQGELLPEAIPVVTLEKTARYLPETAKIDPTDEVNILARIERNLERAPLAGFVAEGSTPYGRMTESVAAALDRATLTGMPVVRVARGNAEGFTAAGGARDLTIAGGNLTATKARLLLMACLLRFGALPPAADPEHPTEDERRAIRKRVADYQEVFDTH